ncbi:MAG: type pilus assembly protein PilA [Patescibacteria group bacterium]|jgi:prepilin-type N-terminal cleavage/methylation domain-containing protein|nr:type pilus assembly protein PilA [Patescibacteria group bacterium]
MKSSKVNTTGFTIVELLIVIVVIGIVAAISIIAYSGIQQRAQDAKIRAVASQFTKAFQRWSVDSGKTTDAGGSGSTAYTDGVCVGGGGGWTSRTVGYICTIDNILVDAGYIPANLVLSVPALQESRPGSYSTLMLYRCSSPSPPTQYAMMYHLNTPDPEEMTRLRNACAGGGTFGPIDTYGMNGGYIFSITR